MKTIWIILLCTLTATACHAKQETPDPGTSEIKPVSASSAGQTNAVLKIHFDEIVSHDDLELRWLDINDSRCPTGVNCFWAGEVKVVLEVTRAMEEGDKPVEIQLTLGVRREPVTASVFGYELELLKVDPYPKDKKTPVRSNYEAEVKISKATQAR